LYSKRIKQSKQKVNFFYFSFGKNNFAQAKILLAQAKIQSREYNNLSNNSCSFYYHKASTHALYD